MVQSYTDLLIEQCEGKVTGDVKEFSEHITEGVTRMRALINGLLAYSRVGTHGKPLEPTDCNVVFEEAVNNLLVAVKESKASVTHDPLPTVSADSTQLTQLFQNLIGNAVKFQKKDVPPQVHVSAEYKEKEWVFSVQDNGIGIDPKYFERIFLPFQRLHTVAEYPGSGIGLATCRKIVERHGGRIWVSAEPSKGSVFYFIIPSPKE